MDWREVAQLWEGNAAIWTELNRGGFNVARDELIAPAFLDVMPGVSGLSGLDIGCGEGYYTRLVAGRGAYMTGVDASQNMIDACRQAERSDPLGIKYDVTSATALPYAPASFDFAVSSMCLMDIEELADALSEANRVLKDGAFFQFVIKHPCYFTARFDWVEDDNRKKVAVACGDYFKSGSRVNEWTFMAVPAELSRELGNLRTPQIYRTLGDWLNLIIDSGFVFERFAEPCPDDELISRYPVLEPFKLVAMFLIVRCRKKVGPV